jgi:uncharacterized membrane protein YkvA (DUF1232 family)
MSKSSRIKLMATAATVVRASTRPGAPNVTDRARAVPRLVRATLDGRYAGTTVGRLGLLAAAVGYVVSPVDLLPEAFLPVLGAADDAVVISWALKTLVEETDRFLAWEAGQGVRAEAGRAGADLAHRRAGRLPSGASQVRGPAREAATNYVLEGLRKRLER